MIQVEWNNIRKCGSTAALTSIVIYCYTTNSKIDQ